MSRSRSLARSGQARSASRLVVFAVMLLCSLFAGRVILLGADRGAVTKGKKKARKWICVTFNELPVAETFFDVDRGAVTDRILSALKKHQVTSAGFVVGRRIAGGYDLLGRWLNDGHALGNLTGTHQDLHELGPKRFIGDIKAGAEALETMLAGFGQKERYFRYPFLHYGNTVEAKREARRYLDYHNIQVAHATVIVEDYLYNLSLEKLGENVDSVDFENLAEEYVTHVLDELERSEADALQVLKRPCRQILLLRANLLNSYCLDELLIAIEGMGYRFTSLDEALTDELYSAPEAYYGSRGVGYVQMLLYSDADLLPAE